MITADDEQGGGKRGARGRKDLSKPVSFVSGGTETETKGKRGKKPAPVKRKGSEETTLQDLLDEKSEGEEAEGQ